MRTSRATRSPAARRRGDGLPLAAGLLAAVVAVGILGMHALTPPDPGAAHHGAAAVAHVAGAEHAAHDPAAVDAVGHGNGSGHLLMICGVMLAAAGGLLLRPARSWAGGRVGHLPPAAAEVEPRFRTQVRIARPPPVLAFSVVRC